jgi:hypothetical protein
MGACELGCLIRQFSPSCGLNKALQRTNLSVGGYYVDADNLDELTIADELLSAPFLRVAIAVGQYQPKGQPWRRYVVYFVTVDQPPAVARRQGGDDVSGRSLAFRR